MLQHRTLPCPLYRSGTWCDMRLQELSAHIDMLSLQITLCLVLYIDLGPGLIPLCSVASLANHVLLPGCTSWQ